MALRPIPSLNSVRSFSAAGRLLSFTSAARELNVTQGAVSRMVQALEMELGVQLFTRLGRSIALTPAGATYLREVTEALGRIETATRSIRASRSNHILALNLPDILAARWLMPKLPEFVRANPDISIDISTGEGPIDLTTDAVDMAIRHGDPPWPGAVATRLMSADLVVVCAPQLLRRRSLKAPADLLDCPLLQFPRYPDRWRDYFESFDLPTPDLSQAPRFERLLLIAEAAASGLGFALLPLFTVASEIASGRLALPIPHLLKATRSHYLLHRPGADCDRKVHIFKAWLLRNAKAIDSMQQGISAKHSRTERDTDAVRRPARRSNRK